MYPSNLNPSFNTTSVRLSVGNISFSPFPFSFCSSELGPRPGPEDKDEDEDNTRIASTACIHAFSWSRDVQACFRRMVAWYLYLYPVRGSGLVPVAGGGGDSERIYPSFEKRVISSRSVGDLDPESESVVQAVVQRYSCIETPILAVPRVIGIGVGLDVGACHFTAPSLSKMSSRSATCAGVSVSVGTLPLPSPSRSPDTASKSPSDSNSVENTIFARCRFSVVICTAHTAAWFRARCTASRMHSVSHVAAVLVMWVITKVPVYQSHWSLPS